MFLLNFEDNRLKFDTAGQLEYLARQASWLLLTAPSLTASLNTALLPPNEPFAEKRSREENSSCESSLTGVAATSQRYLFPQSLVSTAAMESKMNCSPMSASASTDLLPRRVAAAARPPRAPPMPMAASTPPNPARVAVPTERPLMARPLAVQVPVVVVVDPKVTNGNPNPVPPEVKIPHTAGMATAKVTKVTAAFMFVMLRIVVDQVVWTSVSWVQLASSSNTLWLSRTSVQPFIQGRMIERYPRAYHEND